MALWVSACWLTPMSLAGTSSAPSNITTVDTRNPVTGSIAGRVLGNSTPLANAQVELEGTDYRTSTLADGTFILANVPSGSGYVLATFVNGYVSKRITDITIKAGTTQLGDIVLLVAGRPYRIVALSPDVNPPETKVEYGGVGYRYYRILAADGKTPVGDAPVSVRLAGGSTISQAGDESKNWAGRIAGVSDSDGVVRLRLPAAALGTTGSLVNLEVVESGTVKMKFNARVIPREYDQVWKHKAGGGVSGKVTGIRLGGSGAYETEVRRNIQGGEISGETITRSREAEVRAGVEAGAGIKIGAGASAKAGAGGFTTVDLKTTYVFNHGTTDAGENAMKVYVALGDTLSLALGPAKAFYDFATAVIEPSYLNANLESVVGELRIGGYAEAGADLGLKLDKQTRIGAGVELTGEMAGLFGYQESYGKKPDSKEPESSYSLGLATSFSAAVQAGASFGKNGKESGLNICMFNLGGEEEFRGRVVTGLRNSNLRRIEIEQTATLEAGVPAHLAGWQEYDNPLLQDQRRREFTETVKFNLPETGAFTRLSAQAPIWNAIAGGGQGSVIRVSSPADLLSSVLQSAFNDGTALEYEKSVYAAEQKTLGLDVDLDVFVAGLGVSLEGGLERGAEVVNEYGRLWQYKRMVLQTYPALSGSEFPSETILDLERRWVVYAVNPIAQALKQFEQVVANTSSTVIEAGEGAAHAVLDFGQGVIDAGSTIIIQWLPPTSGSGLKALALREMDLMSMPAYLPPAGASNYIYGIGGIYRFTSTNAFKGTGTLAITYRDGDVTGLNEEDLRIYQLPDGTNRWRLIGGTVDTVSNIVSVTITNLGTFAVAPPLPTGDLWLNPSTNTLRADGVSQMTVTVTNLLLNNRNSATQPWLFTAAAVGVDIVNPDLDTNQPGVQLISSNASVTLVLHAPAGGNYASVSLASVAGDASGQLGINLQDDAAPATPTNVIVKAGQSRIWISWDANTESDLAAYRVYYRLGQNGPPYDGVAAIDGTPSPVQVAATNALLRGLTLGTNYFVAVSAVDSTGNESRLAPAIEVFTIPSAPAPPTAVAVQFGDDGTNILMWALSEDDGYNDRDVVRYEVWRAELPGGSYAKIGQVDAGVGVFSERSVNVSAPHFLRYAVTAVDNSGLSSSSALANRMMADGNTVDNDGDNMPDEWERRFGLNPEDPTDAALDKDGDGMNNLAEFIAGTDPTDPHSYLRIGNINSDPVKGLQITWGSAPNKLYSVERSGLVNIGYTNIAAHVLSTPPENVFFDLAATNGAAFFYRIKVE